MKRKARLDPDNIYLGFDEVDELVPYDAATGEGDVDAGDGDLAAGRYRWNAAEGRFDPLQSEQAKAAAGVPTLEQAFYDLVRELPLDPATQPKLGAWREWFRKSFDGK